MQAQQLKRSIVAAVVLFATSAFPQLHAQSAPTLDHGFKDRVMAHVHQLAAFGIRDAGSRQESLAAHYVMEQMKKAGLSVAEEPFRFQSFTLQDAVLEAGTQKAEILKLACNPYSTSSSITGELVLVTSNVPRSVVDMDLDGKLVAVTDVNSFKIAQILKKPKAVLLLSASDFERLQAAHVSSPVISFHGKLSTATSANIIGTLPAKPGAPEIILSAHYDSTRGPGAKDNASGVAAMLELARYFQASELHQNVSLRFVAFGAEEAGLLGSKAYLERHITDLQKCKLLLNIDEVGGDGAIHIDTGAGVKGVPGNIANQLPQELMDKATNDIKDPNQRWSLLSAGDHTLWTSSNCPEWLRSAVLNASANLGNKIIERNHTGSDHRVFIQAGIVATHIGSDGGAEVHAPTDVPEAVDADNIELAARLVVSIMKEVLRSTTN
jgi:hypothetical protein